MSDPVSFVCTSCGKSFPPDGNDWRCTCGHLFELRPWPIFDASRIDDTQPGLWRYRWLFPLEPSWEPISLGEGNSPLMPVECEGREILLKLESLSPTGSFKDRGASVLVTALHGLGIQRVVEASSGNAGVSLAAYAARANIACELCVPATVDGPKLGLMAAYGAEVIEIKGKREYAALAAWAAAAHGAFYASHVYNPFFLVGTETVAYELWEQLGRRAPAGLVLPVGNGTLLLGLYRGFRRLREAGLISHVPRLFGVQSAACAPLYQAFAQGRQAIAAIDPLPTVTSGIAISQPARGEQILAAVRDTGGALLGVTDEQTIAARRQLAQRGFYVEDTSAVAVAALSQLPGAAWTSNDKPMVVLMTGHGLKTYLPR
jgi:threonine synthase